MALSQTHLTLALLDRGADRRAYLLKQRIRNRAELTAAIHNVAGGGSMVDPQVVDDLMQARTTRSDSPLDQLTTREREVLAQIAQGKSNRAIAQTLFLSTRAVEKHINAIFSKLNLTNATDISKRVKATLIMLADGNHAAWHPEPRRSRRDPPQHASGDATPDVRAGTRVTTVAAAPPTGARE